MDETNKKNSTAENEKSLLGKVTISVPSGQSKTTDEDYTCGIGSWRPQCLQSFANVNVAFATLVLATVCVTLNFAALATAISNWEKRYSLPSTVIGVSFTVIDVTGLVTLALCGYLGGRRSSHRPRWIGGGILLIGIGLLVVSMAQFLSEPYQYGEIQIGNSTSGLCKGSDVDPLLNYTNADGCEEKAIVGEHIKVLLCIFCGLSMIGVGMSPMFILGITYIDDSVPKKKAPLYFGIMFSMFAVGPLIGFPLSSIYNGMYVDFYRVNTTTLELTPYDPRWVGAWWLAFIVNAALCVFAAIPFMILPKRFHVKEEATHPQKTTADNPLDMDNNLKVDTSSADEKNSDISQKLKDMPQAVKRLLTNNTYVFLIMAHAGDVAMMCAVATFATKYITDQFRITMSVAAIVMPIALVLPSAFGIFIGGALMRKYKPKSATTARNLVLFTLLTFPTSIALMFVGCDNYSFAGVNTGYSIRSYIGSSTADLDNFTVCNDGCSCPGHVFDPVCGSDGITYLSPCHAGCQSSTLQMNYMKNLSGCTCIGDSTKSVIDDSILDINMATMNKVNIESTTTAAITNNSLNSNVSIDGTPHTIRVSDIVTNDNSGYTMIYDGPGYSYDEVSSLGLATTGICGKPCNQMVMIFTVIMFVFSFIKAIPTTFGLELVLRSVDAADKPFALGIQNTVTQLLGWIPTPIYIGATFDSACVLWESTPCGSKGTCWMYDLPQYRIKYLAIIMAIKFFVLIFYLLAWWSLKNKGKDAVTQGSNGYASVPTKSAIVDTKETHI